MAKMAKSEANRSHRTLAALGLGSNQQGAQFQLVTRGLFIWFMKFHGFADFREFCVVTGNHYQAGQALRLPAIRLGVSSLFVSGEYAEAHERLCVQWAEGCKFFSKTKPAEWTLRLTQSQTSLQDRGLAPPRADRCILAPKAVWRCW